MFQGHCVPIVNQFSTADLSWWSRHPSIWWLEFLIYGTCFKGVVPPLSTNSRPPTSPDGVDIPPSGGWRMNFLLKTSQGGISKFITRSLFFRINKLSLKLLLLHNFWFLEIYLVEISKLWKCMFSPLKFAKCLRGMHTPAYPLKKSTDFR